MSTVKTAVSIPEDLFQELNNTAKELKLSRSGLLTLAVREFLEARENRRMLDQLNKVYADGPTEEEREYLRLMKARYSKIFKDEW